MLVHVSALDRHWKLKDIVIHGILGIAKDIAECIDGLASCDDEAHDAESGLGMPVHVSAIGSHYPSNSQRRSTV